MPAETGVVYVLTNEAMPGLVKIGLTATSVEQRMVELDTTALPLPFECFYAAKVASPAQVEAALHVAFGDARVRARREFFRTDPARVVAVLQLLALEDVTPRTDVIDGEDGVRGRPAARRRGLPFTAIGIPIGATLTFSRKPEETCTVATERTVLHRGIETSLSAAAAVVMGELGYNWNAYHGQAFWLYGDDSVRALAGQYDERGSDVDPAE